MQRRSDDRTGIYKKLCAVLGSILLLVVGFFMGNFILETNKDRDNLKARVVTLETTNVFIKNELSEIKVTINKIAKAIGVKKVSKTETTNSGG